MLRKIFYICLLLFICSCERIFINGDLDGMWRLRRVESDSLLETPDSIFYTFQRHLVTIGIYSETEHPKNWYMGCFEYDGDSIRMNNFYRYPGTDGIRIPSELGNLYIYDTIAKFRVEHLNNDVLILSSSDTQYTFDKW
ncbi:MAG: lipocalin-like domain-containing protein [Bacteroidaceae bacterium]|nr:lipocalin-like domain-containing protein [Bacteroidaceae bacterium]